MERCQKLAEEGVVFTEDNPELQKMSIEIQKIFREVGSGMEYALRYESLITGIFENDLDTSSNENHRNVMREKIERDFIDLGMNAKERIDALTRLFGIQRLFEAGLEGANIREIFQADLRKIIIAITKYIDDPKEHNEQIRGRMEGLREFLKIVVDMEIPEITTSQGVKKFMKMIAKRISRDAEILPLCVSARFSMDLVGEVLDACCRLNYSLGHIDLWATLTPTNDFRTADHPIKLALQALELRENNPNEYINGGYTKLARFTGYPNLRR